MDLPQRRIDPTTIRAILVHAAASGPESAAASYEVDTAFIETARATPVIEWATRGLLYTVPWHPERAWPEIRIFGKLCKPGGVPGKRVRRTKQPPASTPPKPPTSDQPKTKLGRPPVPNKPIAVRVPRGKLSEFERSLVKDEADRGTPKKDIAATFGISIKTVSRITTGSKRT